YSGELSQKVGDLARAYSLDMQPWDEAATKALRTESEPGSAVDPLRFAGRSILLEVDPAISYEVIVKEFAEKFKAAKSAVFAFTWKGGPIYSALSSLEGVQVFSMTSQVTYPRPTGRKDEISVPQDDTSVLLDLIAKTLQELASRKPLMILDSISDLVVSLGFEKAYGFLKAQKEILERETNATALFVAKRHGQDDRAISLVRGLYNVHLAYDQNGLTLTRAG
ncbi:MAG: hypothetical protein ACRD6W_02170, partial [Nitrososphaerales archaeon]